MEKRKDSSIPGIDSDTEAAYQAFSQTEGESSAAELSAREEVEQAHSLVKDVKTRHKRRQKELSQLVTPKDDVSGELKTMKMKSRKKIEEETAREEELAAAIAAAEAEESAREAEVSQPLETEDGTIPMPAEEEVTETIKPEEETIPTGEVSIPDTTVETAPPDTGDIPKATETTESTETTKTPRGSSLRAKMKKRLEKAREQAEDELREEAREERARQRDIRQEKARTRFDTEITEEEMEEKLEAQKMKLRWKKKGPKSDKEMGMPTAEEAFDFFTREYEPEPEVEEKKEGEAKPEDKEETEPKEGTSEEKEEGKEEEGDKKESDKPEDEKPLLEDFGVEGDEGGYGQTTVGRAEVTAPDKLREKEEKLLYIPSLISRQPRGRSQSLTFCKRLHEERHEHAPCHARRAPAEASAICRIDTDSQTFAAIMREFDCRYIDGAIDGSGRYQLDVDINSITFTHHHLFSREHVLSQRLTELYRQYLIRKKKNITEFLIEKLRALKNSALHLKDHILSHKGEMSVPDRANYERRLVDYKYEIRQTRVMRDREELADRQLLKNIINTWKEVKKQREFQKFTSTTVKLQVRREEMDKVRDQEVWKLEMEEELEEAREEHEEEYNRKMAIFREQNLLWEKQQADKREAEKKIKKGREHQKHQRHLDRVAALQAQRSRRSPRAQHTSKYQGWKESLKAAQEIIDAEELPKPEMPEKFEEQAIKEAIRVKAMQNRRRPGEPKLFPELTNTASVTPSNSCPSGEKQRRDEISRIKVFVKVLFNHKEVSRTGNRPLSQDFRVNFGQIYNLKIVQWPESVKFQIFESQGLSSTMLAELYCAIPEASVTSQNVQLEEIEFSSDQRVHYSHEGVGSAVPFSFVASGDNLITLMTTGILNSSVAWAVDDTGVPLIPPSSNLSTNNIFNAMKQMDPVSAIGATGVVNMEKLAKWFEQSRLDPNDPANADLVYLLGMRDFFRLEQLQEEFDLTSDEDMDGNKRFRLLQYRDSEVQEFRNYKLVPVYEREIPRDAFTEYEKKQREEDRMKAKEDIESHRAAVSKFMQKVREQVMQRFRMAAHSKRLEDMVVEDVVPNIGSLFISLSRITEPRRPLKPVRKERKKATAQAVSAGEVNILINIIRASYIPVRKTKGPATGAATSRDPERTLVKNITGETLVRPYVEVMFQRETVRSSIGDGPNPSFNEELSLDLKAPNEDFSSNSLQQITDCLYLNLFDENVIDILEDDRQRESNIHQRIEKKWLGCLKIPFSTLYHNGKIDGTFRLNTPPVLLGYTYDLSQGRGPDSEVEESIGRGEGNTYLSLFITIEPPLNPPEPMKEKFSTNEDEKLMQHAETWQEELNKKYPRRQYKTTVVDVNGKSVFITRYFKSLKPPDDITGKDLGPEKTAELTARFVSLIPSVSDAVVFPGLCDIWSTSDQFLQMLAGDEEEHAVLLTNFFLGLSKKAYLLIGSAIPEGPTAYVLTEEGSDFWIWNAGTGEHYVYRDNYCPLQSVSCVMNGENIWANIHQYEKPSQLNFNLSDTSTWRPFFGRGFSSPGLSSIQPEALVYTGTNKNYVMDLQEKIEQMLKNKMMEWRSRYITRWNRHCTQIMRKLLPVLEENCGKSIGQQHLAELENSFSSYKVSGFPMNMPFVDLETIVESVFSTGVHAQETSDVEFALAVYVHPYPNSVLSIWVYVASLIRNDSAMC
ncbi:LOW QUALITY PROTEIN: coiled-coil and C2 domain-containing protein 2A-like [Haliotis rubra]|uniref:LOW QUALITY PROTEIN: coiled-coil and C2 domain-containing protein 2A-like n=1 Tax=Haliotis rubra TaxID=36100 RepID=UPI001EE612A4|nr:LOW QUALITY PROTEIN: coiled-coil and C2 domain-containing protein 2A-like [Haliotis rubra]